MSTTANKPRRKARRKPTEKQIAERKAQAEALHTDMVAQIEALTSSDKWARFLTATASFHSYSFHNVMMILSQNPDATLVAGFKAWKQRGRQVRKGERAIRIYGYSTRKRTETDPDTGEDVEKRVAFFPLVNVFDIGQTDAIEGADAPDDISQRLTGADPDDIYGRTVAFLTGQGWTVTREAIPGEKNGYTTLDGTRRVVVDTNLSDAQAAKTALHEAAHVLLHTDDGEAADVVIAHRGICEVEAESVAYVAAGLLGLDTADYSVGYVAGWGDGDIEAIEATAKRVLSAVHTLADALTESEAVDTDDATTGAVA